MNNVSFVGNLAADPTLRFNDAGKPRATFRVAVTEGQGDDEKTHWVDVTAFGTLAENLAESGKKGMRVLVIGRLNTYTKTVTIDGEQKDITMTSFTASAVGPDLRWATASVTKVSGSSGNGNGGNGGSRDRSESRSESRNDSQGSPSGSRGGSDGGRDRGRSSGGGSTASDDF